MHIQKESEFQGPAVCSVCQCELACIEGEIHCDLRAAGGTMAIQRWPIFRTWNPALFAYSRTVACHQDKQRCCWNEAAQSPFRYLHNPSGDACLRQIGMPHSFHHTENSLLSRCAASCAISGFARAIERPRRPIICLKPLYKGDRYRQMPLIMINASLS